MAGFRYLLPAAAVVGSAFAVTNTCSAVTTTIQSQGDATALAGCSTFTGSIAIATGTTDNIALNGIETIQGSLIANNVTEMIQLSADSLDTITDSFTLESLTLLTTLNFPRLTTVDTIEWEALPALQGLSFTTGVTNVKSLTIDNTELASLAGLNLAEVDTIYIANNPFLNSISMQLGNITQSLTLNANGDKLEAEFPNLEWAYNMTLRSCASVSIPSLASVNGSIGFFTGTFSSISAPNLTSVGGSLSIVNCPSVSNISLPELTTVGGGFQILNDTDLVSIDGFDSLKTVGGALEFIGDYQNVTLPALGDVRGAFNLTSTEDISSACSDFKQIAGSNDVIKGTFSCNPGKTASGTSGGGATGTGSGGSSSGTSTSGASAMIIPGATGLLGVVAAIFGLL